MHPGTSIYYLPHVLALQPALLHSYALGTIIVEHITRILGRTRFLNGSVCSAIGFPLRLREPLEKIQSSTIGFSRSRSRFHTLVLASVLHAVFFAIMGSERGFASMMIAYVISAFARSFVAGACAPPTRSSYSPPSANARSGLRTLATLYVPHFRRRAVSLMFGPRNVYVPFVAKGGLGFLYGFNCKFRWVLSRVGPALMLYPRARSCRKLRSTARVPKHHRHWHPLGKFLLRLAGALRAQYELHHLRVLADAERAEGRRGARVAVA